MDESTILLIDDNEDDVLLMQRAIEKAEVPNPVQVLNDGMSAVDYLTGQRFFADTIQYPVPVLLLLDLKMPGMSGFEVLEWVRQQPTLKRLWVIVMSHSQERLDIERAYELGANSYLVKPSQFSALVEMTRALHRFWLVMSERPDCQRSQRVPSHV